MKLFAKIFKWIKKIVKKKKPKGLNIQSVNSNIIIVKIHKD